MDERINVDGDKIDEIMLPGFRFHPTDEELVAFYLKRKIQQRPLAIELIKQLDIYKHDPWDLPKLAATGEKEWYFYCPRDRKYRNSARPNRVTSAGFWKATGTDRPVYSSEGLTKCIGLKKSLVFYKGRAAKGIKTDWMMHEFRLPSLVEYSVHPKRFIDKAIPSNDAWAICRIFKKTNTTAQRAVSHSPNNLTMLPKTGGQSSQLSFRDPNINPLYSYQTLHQQQSCAETFSSPDRHNYYKPIYMSTNDSDTMLFNLSSTSTTTADQDQLYKAAAPSTDSTEFTTNLLHTTLPQALLHGCISMEQHHLPELLMKHENERYAVNIDADSYWSLVHEDGSLLVNNDQLPSDAWKSNLVWDSSPCLSDMSTSYKCYT